MRPPLYILAIWWAGRNAGRAINLCMGYSPRESLCGRLYRQGNTKWTTRIDRASLWLWRADREHCRDCHLRDARHAPPDSPSPCPDRLGHVARDAQADGG